MTKRHCPVGEISRKFTNWESDRYIAIFVEPLAIPVAWLTLNFTRLSANDVTWISLFCGVLGNLAGIFWHPLFTLIGFFTFYILDFVDGKVARATGTSSAYGKRLDVLVDRAVFSLSVLSLLHFHLANGKNQEIISLIVYALVFFYLDIIEFSGIVMNQSTGRSTGQPASGWMAWIPSRLSSPLFVLIGFIMFQSAGIAYLGGILSILFKPALVKLLRSHSISSPSSL